jgi:putative component of membrane protein insertase Oxa1/YidC/SpoIIIJ protein YidD
VKRVSKCHPWGSHGFDPVPKKSELNKWTSKEIYIWLLVFQLR